MNKARTLELLSPARDADTAIAAIRHGADAVYIGAPAFGARAAATNSLDDLKRVVDFAHPFGVKVYVTLNTIIYDKELDDVKALVDELYNIGVDALIVQDMALLGLDIPPIELHASTQTDARTIEKVEMLAKAGFSQIVVPREFSLGQIAEAAAVANKNGSEIEAFVHGALCVSYSGDCHAGAVLMGRSANRGECPQICRLQYKLTDELGKAIENLPDGEGAIRHWLSLADMNRLAYLGQLADAGVSSFKIEGRLKNVSYVKNVTAAYSQALDELIAASDGRYRRASFGKTYINFKPELDSSFNRGYTPYFLVPKADVNISSWKTPKWIGREVASVKAVKGNVLTVDLKEQISNGDGLGYFDRKGQFVGFRVNKAEGCRLFAAPGSELPTAAGTILYRNSDTAREAEISRDDSASRRISVRFILRQLPDWRIAVEAVDERGCSVVVASDNTYSDLAKTPQAPQREGIMQRLGGTIYKMEALEDNLGDIFVPSKDLTALRRKAIEALDSDWRMIRTVKYRKKSQLDASALEGLSTTYHDNVANALSARFYKSHGAKVEEMAIEAAPKQGELRVMTTRYCLRRSLGACLKTPNAALLPPKLYLEAPAGRLELRFDCKNCNMQVYINKKPN